MSAVMAVPRQWPKLFLVMAAGVWIAAYQLLLPASEALTTLLPVDRDTHLGEALQFFLYDTPKVLLLLAAVVFVMGMVISYFTPERTRALLAGRAEGTGQLYCALRAAGDAGHRDADRAASRFTFDAKTASSNDVRPALASLRTVMQHCVACHAAYRLHRITSNGESSKAAPTMVDSRARYPAALS